MICLLLQQAVIGLPDFEGLPGVACGNQETAGQIRLNDHELRRYQFDAISQFARRQAPVQAGGDDAQIGCRQFDLDIFRPVARQQSNTVTPAQAAGRQHRRGALDAAQQLAVADLPPLIFDRRVGRLNLRANTKQFTDRETGAGCRGATEFAGHEFASHRASTPEAFACRLLRPSISRETIRLRQYPIKSKF
jgi:hypothetical protein